MKTLIGAGLIALSRRRRRRWRDHDRRDASIDERQHELAQRIEHGWRAGELTPREYRRLCTKRARSSGRSTSRSDGRLSPRERGDLHARLDHLARAVHHERRDVEQRHGSYNYAHPADRRF